MTEDVEGLSDSPDIAVVGMAARLPGARDVDTFWRRVRDGVESVTQFSDAQLLGAGVDPALLQDPNYVKSGMVYEGLEDFDAGFFGFSAREASLLDPQHRHFLEVCWEALEHSGHPPERFKGPIGVFGGSGMNAYMPYNLFTNPQLMEQVGLFLVRHTGNDKDFLTTRVSYCLDLRGPSLNVQTACSTSLVAIHSACQSLLARECDLALAGGVTLELPHSRGYLYQEGEILSPDGHCRAFDHRSQGTLFGSGAGVVVLRRLEDALADGDTIYAVVKGSAVNNDGARKVGYLAPSVDGQADAVVEALNVSGISADTIDYIECHGTGTPVGDPIEITALTQAFRTQTQKSGFCRIGSVKTNIGHLDTAAGVASFVKVVQMLRHKQMAPTLHFEKPNPQIDFARSPFSVNASLRDWAPAKGRPRRAAVNSLGVGGTNAHVILEEAPAQPKTSAARPFETLWLSARTPAALERAAQRLAQRLGEADAPDLGDTSYTLLAGRRRFAHRRAVVASSREEAVRLLSQPEAARTAQAQTEAEGRSVVFLFPGGGAQYPGMAKGLYEQEPVFRRALDECLSLLEQHQSLKLRPLLFPEPGAEQEARARLEQATYALPALLSVELSLAALWKARGLTPQACMGHSMGEYACAQLNGVFSVKDALGIVACRGRLFDQLPAGAMLSVELPEAELKPLLGEGLDLGAHNAPGLCLVSGEVAAIEALEAQLKAREVEARRLHIKVAAHSRMLEPILAPFREFLGTVRFSKPTGPWISNVTGTWVTPEEAMSPDYWVRHLRQPVRFAEGAGVLLADKARVYLEVGPGQTLTQLLRAQVEKPRAEQLVPSLRHPNDTVADLAFFQLALGRLWAAGVDLDVAALFEGQTRRRMALPTYAFERERHWVEPGTGFFMARREGERPLVREENVSRWGYVPRFREQAGAAPEAPAENERWLLVGEQHLLVSELARELSARGAQVLRALPGEAFRRVDAGHFTLRLDAREDWEALWDALGAEGRVPPRIVDVTCRDLAPRGWEHAVSRYFLTPLALMQSLTAESLPPGLRYMRVTQEALPVEGHATSPEQALSFGPLLVGPKELPELKARVVDLQMVVNVMGQARELTDELLRPDVEAPVALRGRRRLVQVLERTALDEAPTPLRDQGVYLITGGLGGIGRTLAELFARKARARLALVSRSAASASHAELQRTLEGLGAQVLLLKADVTDADQLREAIAQVRERFGALHGVVHAAGTLEDGPLESKTRDSALRVLAPKALGALALEEALQGAALDFFVSFASTSAWIGPPGQVDYVAANAFLLAQAARLEATGVAKRALALGWGVWQEVGMAAAQLAPQLPPGESVSHPLLQRRVEAPEGHHVFRAIYDAKVHWVLDEHRMRGGGPVLPGTAYVELARAAWALARPGEPLELTQLSLVSPLDVPDGEVREVEIELAPEGDGFTFRVRSRAAGNAWTEHATARLHEASSPRPAALDVSAAKARCGERPLTFGEGEQALPQDALIAFGPRWKVLRGAGFGASEALGRLELPRAYREDLATYGIPPGLLDIASGFAFSLLPDAGQPGKLHVPVSYRQLQVWGPWPEVALSHVRVRQEEGRGALLDVTLTDSDGNVFCAIEGYLVASVEARRFGRSPKKQGSLLESWLPLGIKPAEGQEAFLRALALADTPALFVSSMDLHALAARSRPKQEAAKPASAPATAQAAAGSGVAAADAPRDDVERKLAELWQQLLGAPKVGLKDNFFELGGHSLIAVRLFARIKKTLGADLTLATLFEAPTLEQCAALVREAAGIPFTPDVTPGDAAPAAQAPGVKAAPKGWSPLVTIQKGGNAPPFFCVHGAGGNVLNFRELAQALGKEQPFYGLQARGVDGKLPPADSIEEMASIYLESIRQVQPHGPYLLGGYSGGGVVAYEMAQRLHALGEPVALVAFLDTFHPATQERRQSFNERLRELRREGAATYVSRKLRTKVERDGTRLLSQLKLRWYEQRGEALPIELRNLQLTERFQLLASRYVPSPYAGPVTLFRAQEIHAIYAHMGTSLGWEPLVPALNIREVPGDHDSLVREPNVHVLGRLLREALDDAQPGSRGEARWAGSR
ncbi:type I polyketide synthase [Corallococcus macrosporus]|uniref:Polyketide/non-ribosomal peptide synthetase n=1 Tax=Myxococcus fulvus (strain ATCC BAA-855 / HW-1) TaxID=483219 RepID=F8CHC1_MYXFH|nr:type I polyketide synthase [Corallococcus macrosporus]AEI66239.1 polyketide/non-ribosomal peptide synthetase [Corallococcus macrosporus]